MTEASKKRPKPAFGPRGPLKLPQLPTAHDIAEVLLKVPDVLPDWHKPTGAPENLNDWLQTGRLAAWHTLAQTVKNKTIQNITHTGSSILVNEIPNN